MGIHIRKVPANWESPKYIEEDGQTDDPMLRDYVGYYKPFYDCCFQDAFEKWLSDFDRIRRGDLTEAEAMFYPLGLVEWIDDEENLFPSLSKSHLYRPYRDEEAEWFQVYSSFKGLGIPITPAFESKEVLLKYLIENGDYQQQREFLDGEIGKVGYSPESAKKFVEKGREPPETFLKGDWKLWNEEQVKNWSRNI